MVEIAVRVLKPLNEGDKLFLKPIGESQCWVVAVLVKHTAYSKEVDSLGSRLNVGKITLVISARVGVVKSARLGVVKVGKPVKHLGAEERIHSLKLGNRRFVGFCKNCAPCRLLSLLVKLGLLFQNIECKGLCKASVKVYSLARLDKLCAKAVGCNTGKKLGVVDSAIRLVKGYCNRLSVRINNNADSIFGGAVLGVKNVVGLLGKGVITPAEEELV